MHQVIIKIRFSHMVYAQIIQQVWDFLEQLTGKNGFKLTKHDESSDPDHFLYYVGSNNPTSLLMLIERRLNRFRGQGYLESMSINKSEIPDMPLTDKVHKATIPSRYTLN